ncbi:Rsm22-domain-containing protein [Hysterangium stoloniferum]|nr:Rsm22-domain-containing protein [Hysterangium stoloniferum]
MLRKSLAYKPSGYPSIVQRCTRGGIPRRSLHASRSSLLPVEHTPNPPLDLDYSIQEFLKDMDMTSVRSNAESRKKRKLLHDAAGTKSHHELEIVASESSIVAANRDNMNLMEDEDVEDGLFPASERKSPAASFGSRNIGAVILPFELQATIIRLISDSVKSLVHADAQRLFHGSAPETESGGAIPKAWSMHYIPPNYTEAKSSSKVSHIKARLNRHRDGTAFASVVMPAQYAVVLSVLNELKNRLGKDWAQNVERFVEWGSGTGAGMWAALHTFQKPPQPPSPDPSEPTPETILSSDPKIANSSLVSYVAIEKRDGLSSIARRLIRDIPLTTSVSLQKGLCDSDRVPRASETGLGTVAMSAFNLQTLQNARARKEMVKEMWESGADVLVIIEDGSANGFQQVADAREYLLKLGRREVEAVERDRDDDGRGKRGAHVVSPCPHDKPCPLAFHQERHQASIKTSVKTVRCTFVQRLQRPSFVRRTKHAKKGEEDVGYSYVVIRRGERVRTVPAQLEGRRGAVGRWADEAREAREMGKKGKRESWVVNEDDIEAALVSMEEVEVEGAGPAEADEGLKGEELEAALREEAYTWSRINFSPLKRSRHVYIDACTPEGSVMRMSYPRSQGKQIYYDARKSRWGDIFPHVSKHTPVPRYTGVKIKTPKGPVIADVHEIDPDERLTPAQERQLKKLLEPDEKKVKKADQVVHARGLGKGRGGEGALAKDMASATRAGWSNIMGELKVEEKQRRRERRAASNAKEIDID